MEDNTYVDNRKEFAPVPERGSARRTVSDRAAGSRLALFYAAALSLALILILGLFSLLAKDKEYSADENRYLATAPKLTFSSLADGKFMEDTESWLSDQFFLRSLWVKTKTKTDLFFGKREINGVYIGRQHYLLEKPTPLDEAKAAATVNAVNAFTANHPTLRSYFAIAPNATEILPELLPANAPNENQTEQIGRIYASLDPRTASVDLCAPLKAQTDRKSLYYRTDHHWTTAAASVACGQIAAAMALDTGAVPYKTYAVTNTFRGTMASTAGLFNATDNIYITVPSQESPYVVTYVSENRKSASMFDLSKLDTKNQYEVFFGGNYPLVRIDTSLAVGRVLMVVKDSYANCLIPMLTPYFKTIVVVDPRYYTDDIDNTILMEGVTDVLWLYNANTFLADTSIAKVFG